jgi:tetratricopeptide (TPR) repeat protein
MARKLNKNVVGVLTLLGMVLLAVAGVVLMANMPGQDPAVYAAEAKQLEEKGEYNKAMQTYVRACSKDPDRDPEYMVKAARCALEDGEIGASRKLIQQARVKNPKLRSAAELSAKLELELMELFPSGLQATTLLDEAKKLAEIDDQSAMVQESLGTAYAQLLGEAPENAEKAETALKRAWELDPSNPKVVKVLAGMRWQQAIRKMQENKRKEGEGLAEDLQSLLTSAIKQCGDAGQQKAAEELKQMQGLYRVLQGQSKEGLAILQALTESETAKAEVRILLGAIYAGFLDAKLDRDLDKAEKLLREAVELQPGKGDAYLTLGRVYRAQRVQAKEQKEHDEKFDQEVKLYEEGLEKVERKKHFRAYRNNESRIEFFTELCLLQVGRATETESNEKKEEYLRIGESWVEKLKQEVDLEGVPVRILSAHLLNARGDYVNAIREGEAAERALGGRPNFRLSVLLGDLYSSQRQWGAARDSLLRALAASPREPVLYVRVAEVLLQMNQAEEAMRFLEPGQPPELQAALDADRGARALRMEAYRQRGQLELAEKESLKLREGTPKDELLAVTVLMMQQRYDEAETKLKKFMEERPDNMQALRLLMQIYAATGRFQEAKATLQKAQERDPNNREARRLMLMVGQEEGTATEEQVVAFFNEEPDVYTRSMWIAEYYFSKQKLDQVKKYLDQAEEAKPDQGECIDRQFRLALLDKDWDRAEKYAAKHGALNVDGTEGKITQGRLAVARADADKAAGNTAAAEEGYRRAVDLMTVGLQKYPKYSMGWTYLSEAYGSAGRALEAKNSLVQALAVDPTNGYANRALALVYINEGDESGAEKYLQAAARALPNDPWVQQRLRLVKEKENPKEGIAAREKLRAEKPTDVENLVLLARLYGDSKVADYDKAAAAYREALKLLGQDAKQKSANGDLAMAREFAEFLGQAEVNRPSEGEQLLNDMFKAEEDKPRRALLAVYLARFYELQNVLATADRHIRQAVSLNASAEVLTAAAEFCSRNNQLRQALEYYERVLKAVEASDPAGKTARVRMIALLLTVGDLDRAKEEIDAFLKLFPDDPQGMVYEGAYHRMGGDIQKAKEAFDGYIERNPDNALALWQRGQLFILLGRWEAAIKDLREAKAYNLDGFGYQHRIALADALLEAGKGGEAITELESILQKMPEEAAVAEALVDIYRRVNPPRYADAENLITSYMRRYPKDPRWPRLLGAMGEASQDWNKAVSAYEKAAEINRNNSEAIRALFAAYRQAGRPEEIIRYATEKLTTKALAGSPPALAVLAWAYSRTGDDQKCVETFDQALAAAGEDVIAAVQVVGEMVGVMGPESALSRAKTRAQADPENPDRKKVVIQLLWLNRQYDQAVEVCREISKMATGRVGDAVFAEVAEGMLQEALSRPAEAKAKYEAALKLSPDQPIALNNIAFLLVDKLDQPAEALPYAERARRLSPNSPDVLDTYGWVLAKNGRLGEALGVLLRAVDTQRENSVLLYHLGKVCQMRGEPDEAKRWLEAAKTAATKAKSPELPRINEALEQIGKTGA